MYVAASTASFPDLPLEDALAKLVDLEFTRVEIAIQEGGRHLKPSQVLANFDEAQEICRRTLRLTPIAYNVQIEAEGDEYYQQFAAVCRLAKANKVVTIVVPAGELGTPFNAEVERLRELVAIATVESVVVAVKTEVGHVTQDPDTVQVLCDNVKGLGITFDPSHFIYGENAGRSYDHILKYAYHVHLRDTSQDQLQVRVGQGEIEYGRLISQLAQVKYNRALTIDIAPLAEVDQMAELRKLRLLLESLL
ncbi:MAG: TIM barrel protein [Planctomycetales bacterium]|nr:TIM barrel protein [Planctomycetales bacterium]